MSDTVTKLQVSRKPRAALLPALRLSTGLTCAETTCQVRFNHDETMEFTVAITGASGSIYAQRTLMHLAASGVVERINLIMSEAATTVARVELGADLRGADHARINEWVGLAPDSQ